MRISDWSSDVCSSDLGQWRMIGDIEEAIAEKLSADQSGERADRREDEDIGNIERLDRRRPAVDNGPGLLGPQQYVLGALNDRLPRFFQRSAERRGGEEGVSTCRTPGANIP